MFRVITANLNGVRSAASKGFFDWVKQQDAAIVAVQEVKAQHEHVGGVFDTVGRSEERRVGKECCR